MKKTIEGEQTTILISKDTRNRLQELGKFNDTYDTIINRLIDTNCKKQKQQ